MRFQICSSVATKYAMLLHTRASRTKDATSLIATSSNM